jgi:hypothetical protein
LLQAEAHLETDQAILNREREYPGVKSEEKESQRQHKRYDGLDGERTDEPSDAPDYVEEKNRKNEKMKSGNKFGVIFEILSHW